jgi:hypothetical protein
LTIHRIATSLAPKFMILLPKALHYLEGSFISVNMKNKNEIK